MTRALWRPLAWLPAMMWWSVSVYLLLFKPAGLPSGIPYFDKVGHFVLFALLAALLTLGMVLRGVALAQCWRPVLQLCLLWAVGSELAQGLLTTSRSAEWLDGVADMAGALTGIMLAARGVALYRRRV